MRISEKNNCFLNSVQSSKGWQQISSLSLLIIHWCVNHWHFFAPMRHLHCFLFQSVNLETVRFLGIRKTFKVVNLVQSSQISRKVTSNIYSSRNHWHFKVIHISVGRTHISYIINIHISYTQVLYFLHF